MMLFCIVTYFTGESVGDQVNAFVGLSVGRSVGGSVKSPKSITLHVVSEKQNCPGGHSSSEPRGHQAASLQEAAVHVNPQN